LERRGQAVARLKYLGTNALPLLINELNYAADIEKTNKIEAIGFKVRIWAAFNELGSQAMPLIENLITNLNTDRNPGNAAQALANIGGPRASAALLNALTNPTVNVQISAASALAVCQNDDDLANEAVERLLNCLETGSAQMRGVAMNTLSTLKRKPEVVIPALLRIAKSDPEFVLRAYAIQSIGCFGTNAISAKTDLEIISKADGNNTVQKTAKRILASLELNSTNLP
jgi:HEAT repeat protein